MYAQVAEADPGEGCWPFADTVLVVGDIAPAEVRRAVSASRPDDVAADASGVPPAIAARHGPPVCAIWWD